MPFIPLTNRIRRPTKCKNRQSRIRFLKDELKKLKIDIWSYSAEKKRTGASETSFHKVTEQVIVAQPYDQI
jgi:hypothetical protein